MLVEPREPYRVKAGIFNLCGSFEANVGLFLRSFDIECVCRYFIRERLSQSLGATIFIYMVEEL